MILNKRKYKEMAYRLGGIFFLLLLWQLAALQVRNTHLLPSPLTILHRTIQLSMEDDFFSHLLATIFRGMAGYVLAMVFALLFMALGAYRKGIGIFLQPTLVFLRSIPVISFILLAIIWMQPSNVPILIAFTTMFPILATNLIKGYDEVNPQHVEMAFVFNVPLKRQLLSLYLPSVLPFFFSGTSSAIGFGWRAVVIGEVLSQPHYGLGTSMKEAQIYLLVNDLMAWTLIAIIVSYLFELLLQKVARAFSYPKY